MFAVERGVRVGSSQRLAATWSLSAWWFSGLARRAIENKLCSKNKLNSLFVSTLTFLCGHSFNLFSDTVVVCIIMKLAIKFKLKNKICWRNFNIILSCQLPVYIFFFYTTKLDKWLTGEVIVCLDLRLCLCRTNTLNQQKVEWVVFTIHSLASLLSDCTTLVDSSLLLSSLIYLIFYHINQWDGAAIGHLRGYS